MRKVISLLAIIALMLSTLICAAAEVKEHTVVNAVPMYAPEEHILRLTYKGLDMEGLAMVNEVNGSDRWFDAVPGCSLTFATYTNGVTGCVRNMDLQLSEYGAFEMLIYPGDNVKYPTWALAYCANQANTYAESLTDGLSEITYLKAPFFSSDAMSVGYNDQGEKGALYGALLMRSEEQDEQGNYIWTCPGTNTGAALRCPVSATPGLIIPQCLTIDEALKYTGAVNEQYERIFPYDAPVLDVYSLNQEKPACIHWSEALSLIDSTGRHGVLEFVDNYPIWHEGIDYCFNFYLQEDYLHNPDGSYRETGASGMGRYQATVPFLDKVHTVSDHLDLMEGVRYSYMTFYNEDAGYIGRAWNGEPVDWRSELAHADMWASYDHYKQLGLDTGIADARYPLQVTYLNTKTGQYEVVSSYEYWLDNHDHLTAVYDANFVTAEENRDELMNCVRWSGMFYGSLTDEQLRSTGTAWQTYFRVVADPMNFRVTRWFNENINTADTIDMNSLLEN